MGKKHFTYSRPVNRERGPDRNFGPYESGALHAIHQNDIVPFENTDVRREPRFGHQFMQGGLGDPAVSDLAQRAFGKRDELQSELITAGFGIAGHVTSSLQFSENVRATARGEIQYAADLGVGQASLGPSHDLEEPHRVV
jgi:hypothetical protein